MSGALLRMQGTSQRTPLRRVFEHTRPKTRRTSHKVKPLERLGMCEVNHEASARKARIDSTVVWQNELHSCSCGGMHCGARQRRYVFEARTCAELAGRTAIKHDTGGPPVLFTLLLAGKCMRRGRNTLECSSAQSCTRVQPKEARQKNEEKAKHIRISKSFWHEHVLQHLYVRSDKRLAAYRVGWTVHRRSR